MVGGLADYLFGGGEFIVDGNSDGLEGPLGRVLRGCVCGKAPRMKLVNKKPILPTEQELEKNPRSRSAKLRIAEKL